MRLGQMNNYNLYEYQTLIVDDYKLTADERLYLSEMAGDGKARFHWRELRNGLEITATSWVGVIQLEGAVINIRPKFDPDFRGLLLMLEYARGNNHFTMAKDTTFRKGVHLLEIIVELLCREIDALLKLGIFKEYIHLEEALSVLRGRPDLRRQLTDNYLSPIKIACCFDELSTDVLENRVIRAALETARRLRLPKRLALRVQYQLGVFNELCGAHRGDFPCFTYNRLNEHYRHAHELCRLLLETSGTGDLFFREEKGFFTLLIDMNLLFERFVARLIENYLPSGWSLKAQYVKSDAITREDGGSYREIRPDLLLVAPDGSKRIIDTKYKLYNRVRIETADLFQLAFYAQAFLAKDEKGFYRACLIYPDTEDSKLASKTLFLNRRIEEYKGEIAVNSLNLKKVLRAIEEKDEPYLSNLVRKICSVW
jgi:5-methylcytosine-specific restriction enzyme subunit McrC